MPVFLGIAALVGFVGWIASEDSVATAKASGKKTTDGRVNGMAKKVSKIPTEKYCAEAREILKKV